MLLSAEQAAAGRVRVYRGASVVDGTGAPRRTADVAVEGSRVVGIRTAHDGDFGLPEGSVEADAAGLVLAPGFIDMDARTVLRGQDRTAGIRQGVTCEVVRGSTADVVTAIGAATAANVAVLAAHDDLRRTVIGHEDRAAEPEEIARMAALLDDALDAGAFGMSSELTRAPGMDVLTAELEVLCRVVAERGGYWAPRVRSHGAAAHEECREVLDIGRRAGCPIHLTHAPMNAAPNPGPTAELLALVDEAIAEGIDVSLDTELPGATAPAASRRNRGSDGILIGDEPHPHPLRYGSLTLEQAVQHLSAIPARRLGLDLGDAPRGVIRPGATADLVLFDPETVAADAAFDALRVDPAAIVEVLVGGVPVIESGEPTGRTPGAALRRVPPAHRATVPLLDADIDAQAAPFVLAPRARIVAPAEFAGVVDRLRDVLELSESADPDAGIIALVRDPDERARESFCIDIDAGRIEVRAAEAVGAFRGVMALRQLLPPEGVADARLPAGRWRGAPAFGWRGAMLDVARHFRPASDIRRLIDVLAAHQLNILHLHLTDDQGWRFEVPGFPRLTEVGARRGATQRGHGPLATVEPGVHEGHYTTAELRDLVRYAAERFITLVPEVELPGHVQAALAAYPELGNADASDPADGPWERFGVNARTLAPTEESLAFGRAAIDALCDVFDSPWIGIGGDEVPVTEWERSHAAATRMQELGLVSPKEIQPWFTAQLAAHVRSRGRRALAWDEVLEGDVPEAVDILAWRAPVALQEALDRGIPVVACPDLEVYLDYRQSESADEPVPVGPPLTIEDAYTLRIDERALGGQANTWTEHLPTRDRVDYAMFPRLSAIAERLWAGGEPGAWEDFARRLPVQLRRLAATGVRYRPLDGPAPDQRRPGVPGKPMSVEDRRRIVADLVAGLGSYGRADDAHP